MKILVMHDKDGNITSVGVPGREFGGQISLIPEKGQVTEMEIPDVTDDVTDEKNLQHLLDIVEQYRIELCDQRPKLVRKEEETMTTEASLDSFANRVSKTEVLRKGAIVFRLSGVGGGDYFLDCSRGDARLTKGTPPSAPLIEVIGDAQKILAILEGKKDARAQFLAGGFRIRGDLRYVSDLALELGIIQEPL